MLEKENKQQVTDALLKKAIGYNFEEVVEEFSFDEESGQMKKSKVKVNKKHSPPDMTAVKTLLSLNENQITKYDTMTEDELLIERKKLLEELAKTPKIDFEEEN